MGSCWDHLGTIVGSQWIAFCRGDPGVAFGSCGHPKTTVSPEGSLGIALRLRAAMNLLLTFLRCAGGRPVSVITVWRRGVGALTLVARSVFGRAAGRVAPVASARMATSPGGKKKTDK